MITVKELINILTKLDPDKTVWVDGSYYGCAIEQDDIRQDDEGNLVISYHNYYRRIGE